jgi:CheY-like chemotaxis protein
MLIWLVDDSLDHHQVADGTVARLPGVELAHHYDGVGALAEYAALQDDPARPVPAVVLMDYFLGAERGDQVTRGLRALERRSRAVIIGYSSVASGSARIVEAGGDLVLRKHCDQSGINPSLLRYLSSLPPAMRA